MVKAGIATHFVSTQRLYELEKLLSRCTNDSEVRGLLNKFNEQAEGFTLAPHIKHINYCFAAGTLEEIIERLEKVNNEWSVKTLEVSYIFMFVVLCVRYLAILIYKAEKFEFYMFEYQKLN